MEQKLKICIDCNLPKFIWAHGRCKECDVRFKMKNPKHRKPELPPVALCEDEDIKEIGQLDIFEEIWYERDRVSFISGENLEHYFDTPFFVNLFAHVLAKAKNKYPKFKLYKKNIVLLSPREHSLFDQGTMDLREKYRREMAEQGIIVDWDKLFDLFIELKEEYNEKFNTRR